MSGCYPSNLDTGADADTSPLIKHIQELEKRLHELESDSISGGVLFTMRQSIETWQRGCEVKINTLMKCNQELENRIEECKKMINRLYELKKVSSEECLTFDKLEKAAKWMADNGKNVEQMLGAGLIYVTNHSNPDLNGIYEKSSNKENPSRQHLEECLHKKNVQIKQLEDELYRTRGEVSAAQFKFHLAEIQNTKLSTQVDSLLDQVKHARTNCCPRCLNTGFYYTDPGTGKYPCDGVKTKCTECNHDNQTINF